MARLRVIRALALAAIVSLFGPAAAAAPHNEAEAAQESLPARLTRLAELPARPRPTVLLSGIATWYDAQRGGGSSWYTRQGILFYGAAGPELRALVPHRYLGRYRVVITSTLTGRSIYVDVVDYCSCEGRAADPADDRLIDLSPLVWRALGVPLGRGVMPITMEVLRP
jgi:hypothetical protein